VEDQQGDCRNEEENVEGRVEDGPPPPFSAKSPLQGDIRRGFVGQSDPSSSG
jgi:hypothetical protein